MDQPRGNRNDNYGGTDTCLMPGKGGDWRNIILFLKNLAQSKRNKENAQKGCVFFLRS
jgi:hypothetical protein